ncbi:MAG TPA: glycosyltransferase family 4 protein, partial [Usitatibacter sp.]|nr:glycosyltransferase family 4 protein [Usitatibacter sp.]
MTADPTHIVMVGTDRLSHGGIASVLATWRSGGLFERWPISYIVTHREGRRRDKLATAARAGAAFATLAWRHGRGVLHVHAASRWSFWRKSAYMAAALLAGWPVIFHLHGGGFARFVSQECGPLARRAVRFFLDRATVIVVVSERWAGWMHGITANPRIICVPNPVALPPAVERPRERGLVAFAGRCREAKGVFDLLDAMSEVAPSQPALRLECAGDGDLGRMVERAAALGIGERVRLRGWIGARERDDLLTRASVFALPSHAEALPVSLLEAMAAGCAVVATRVGGIPDLVEDGVNGLLVPPRDPAALARALRTLLDDPELASRLGRAARATVAERYTLELALERLEQV